VALTIRPATGGDAAAVAALVDAMGGHDGATGNPAVGAVYHAALSTPGVRMLVAEEDGAVVGYAEVQARPYMLDGVRQGWLAALCVASERRGGGVGAALVAAVDEAAAALGCSEIAVDSSSFRTAAHRFYRREGFEQRRPAMRFRRAVRNPGVSIAGAPVPP
jgi:GNAT superfamily N-acetyltransferase